MPPGQTYGIPVDDRAKALAASGQGRYFFDMRCAATHLRVLASGIGRKGALMVALPLTDVDHALSKPAPAAGDHRRRGHRCSPRCSACSWPRRRSPRSPASRDRPRAIAANPERIEHERVDMGGNDELARLGRTFDNTLDALERSMQSQRNLVADASHELRTPIATIRANLQLMRDENLLSPEDRAALRADVIEELDELTALVGDVVELARGSKPSGEPGDVRLDAVVARRDRASPPARAGPGLPSGHRADAGARRGGPDLARGDQPARQRRQVEPGGRRRGGDPA